MDMSSVSEEQQKQQLQQLPQLIFQQQMQHYSYDDTSSSSSSSYYAAYYNQQQNPNFYASAYQPQHQPHPNYQHAPTALPNMEGMTWTGQGRFDPVPGQFGGPVQVAQPTNMGGGTRGSRSYRGRGSGNFGNRPPGTGVTGLPIRGRGRGRGRAGFSHISGKSPSSSSTPNPSTDEVAKPTAEADNQREQKPKPKTAAPNKPPGQTFRCELCRVDCTALDLLEQHKNGKKHKKNLERAGQLQPVAVSTEPVAQKTLVQIPPAESFGLDNSSSVKPAVAENQSGVQKRGTKRKMRGGRNGRNTRRANEPPKVVIPIICQLCNVKCDTQEVYERHLAGKKHMSKLKRYEGHQSMYGPVGLQALYPPMSQTLVNPQGPQQSYPGPQGSVPQPEPNMLPQAHYAAEPLATGFESGFQHNAGYTVPGPTS